MLEEDVNNFEKLIISTSATSNVTSYKTDLNAINLIIKTFREKMAKQSTVL